jgi:hypothetical protein
MTTNIEQFNAYQEDVRRRANSLVSSIFILSGGTLTLSISIMTGKTAPALASDVVPILKLSWVGLFMSILLGVLTLMFIIARDYAVGERWRKVLKDTSTGDIGSPGYIDVTIWVAGLAGLLSFLLGMLGQAYVAWNVI